MNQSQALAKADVAATEKKRDNLAAGYHFRVRIGVSSGLLFHVRAEGDNFAEALAALEHKQREAA